MLEVQTADRARKREDFANAITKLGGNGQHWLRYYDYVFADVDFSGSTVLDIGGGTGYASYFAAAGGAKRVICLEPEVDGSRSTMVKSANSMGSIFDTHRIVEVVPRLLQDYSTDIQFDVVIIHNTINHFDEDACRTLSQDTNSQRRYATFFDMVSALIMDGGFLVVADCSNRNFFGDIGVRNPVAPTIDWPVHQPPEVWARLLSQHGFTSPRIKWTSDRRLGLLGRLLFRNRTAAYFLQSHFCLTLRKSRQGA